MIGIWDNSGCVALVAPICEKQGWNASGSNTRNLAVYDPGGLGITAHQVNCASGEGVQNNGTWLGDGVDARLSIDYHPTFSPTMQMTFEIFQYWDHTATWFFGVIDSVDDFFRANLIENTDGTYDLLVIYEINGVQRAKRTLAISIPPGWYHFALCTDNGNWWFRVNGEEYFIGSDLIHSTYTFSNHITPMGYSTPWAPGPVKWLSFYNTCISLERSTANAANAETFYDLRMASDGTLTAPGDSKPTHTGTAVGDHTKYAPLRFRKAFAGAVQTHIPLVCNLKYMPDGFWNTIDAAGDQMVLADTAGNEVACELVGFDKSAKTGRLWIKVPSVSPDSDTELVLWYGGTTERSLASTSVYSGCYGGAGNYAFALHSDGSVADAAGNITPVGTDLTDADGVVGGAYDYNSETSKISVGTIPVGLSDLTVLTWMNVTEISEGKMGLFSGRVAPTSITPMLIWENANDLSSFMGSTSISANLGRPVFGINRTRLMAITYDRDDKAIAYMDALASSNGADISAWTEDSMEMTELHIGYYPSAENSSFSGMIDEPRAIIGVALSAEDIETHYATELTYNAAAAWDIGEEKNLSNLEKIISGILTLQGENYQTSVSATDFKANGSNLYITYIDQNGNLKVRNMCTIRNIDGTLPISLSGCSLI